jgi:hypothetical protein
MSSPLQDGGAAFPRPASEYTKSGTCPDGNDPIEEQNGMSLRDWFAGQALIGYLAAETESFSLGSHYQVAQRAYAMADVMLQQRGWH